MENSNIEKLFGAIGFGFPENDEQLEAFDKEFANYQFEGNVNKIDPEKILNEVNREKVKVSNIDYHKRTVLAAQIVYKLINEYTLGHLKLQKLMYLCQHTSQMSLHTNFLKQAMGPYDPHLMRSIDKQFKANKWFSYNNNGYPKYISMQEAGGHSQWFDIYFKNHLSDIDFIIEKFRKTKTDQVELVATLFACWQQGIQEKNIISDQLLIKKLYAWHKDKSKFDQERVLDTIKWMKNEGIYPS